MQNSYYGSASSDDLLDLRMAMLGLDLSAVESRDRAMFEAITRCCACCNSREACELDLDRDPNDPVWQTYCSNRSTLTALPEACWLGPR
jgi:hypothetical protein